MTLIDDVAAMVRTLQSDKRYGPYALTLPVTRWFDIHSTAELRRELHDPTTNRWMRCAIYAELLRRRHAR